MRPSKLKNWQENLTEDEWFEFVEKSKSDKILNDMWVDYKNQKTPYQKIVHYEYNLYLSYCRDEKINQLFNETK